MDLDQSWQQTAVIACAAWNAAVLCSMAENKDKLMKKPKDFMPTYGAKSKRRNDGRIIRSDSIVRNLETMFGTGGIARPRAAS